MDCRQSLLTRCRAAPCWHCALTTPDAANTAGCMLIEIRRIRCLSTGLRFAHRPFRTRTCHYCHDDDPNSAVVGGSAGSPRPGSDCPQNPKQLLLPRLPQWKKQQRKYAHDQSNVLFMLDLNLVYLYLDSAHIFNINMCNIFVYICYSSFQGCEAACGLCSAVSVCSQRRQRHHAMPVLARA